MKPVRWKKIWVFSFLCYRIFGPSCIKKEAREWDFEEKKKASEMLKWGIICFSSFKFWVHFPQRYISFFLSSTPSNIIHLGLFASSGAWKWLFMSWLLWFGSSSILGCPFRVRNILSASLQFMPSFACCKNGHYCLIQNANQTISINH